MWAALLTLPSAAAMQAFFPHPPLFFFLGPLVKLENKTTLKQLTFYRLTLGSTRGKWLPWFKAGNLLGCISENILALQTCGSHFNASFQKTNALPLGFLPAQQTHHYANVGGTKPGVLWLDTASREATRTSICNFHLQTEDRNKENS